MADAEDSSPSGENNELDQHPFKALGLRHNVVKAVAKNGYENPTNIQAQAIPVVLSGRDVIGSSQTGTGKTAAFALPVISNLKKHGKFRCLVLEPTRELAEQVANAFRSYSHFTNLKTSLIQGGVGYGRQREMLQKGVDIVVATPGRLLDHYKQKSISFRDIQVVVLDEVDRMLDMGFLPDVRRIVDKCPKDRQTLFFSATMPPSIQTLAEWALRDPLEIEVGHRQSPAETVAHAFYPVAMEQRDELLLTLLKSTDFHSLMIFTRTKKEADMLHSMLSASLKEARTAVMHSDIRQSDRTKALQGFRSGEFDVIIATDVAARGLDISGVTHVINYRVPENPEDYVHRIGRTGRAQKEGDAFTLLSADEADYAKAVERFIGRPIERRRLEGFPYVYTALLEDKPLRPVRPPRRPSPDKKRRRQRQRDRAEAS
ncbi:MAG: DEAD/DEAH box helicase [Verrucomicrobiae bacterium]|nr:DEAD/DEAH box helicase [Verrucomicrobiae bacterium]